MPSDSDTTRAALLEIVWRLAPPTAARMLLSADSFARAARRSGSERGDLAAPAVSLSRSLCETFGGCDDTLRRGAVAAMAIGLDRCAGAGETTVETLAARSRLARRLTRAGAYGPDAYAVDAAFACGLVVPLAPFRVVLPAPHQSERPPQALLKSLASGVRVARAYGGLDALGQVANAGLSPWVELHLDLRACSSFNADGFVAAYLALADLLRRRTDLAGLRAASWLYDPQLTEVSPGLRFVRTTAERGGARFVPVRTDPVQRVFAAARSPERARLIASGAYRPACYAMSWVARDLIAWADRTGPERVTSPIAA